ncbi:DUF1361 domain-containing protein [Nocardia sp. SYP-A9097]|uniref:DUF1361 domain-containing protein n=1 Tax=Nocardia sp. SYP-A9097 TaxID=2663237 RepID=UPI00129AE058|nr:DUF1361 domain-containing protein [Nocardia sp. SYP-A9097]MRH87464.1 DUF1361 domain-containing protein [Nocardia sp. SYP-A9097]
MDLVNAVTPSLSGVLHRDLLWMIWNSVLAWIPVALALLVFRSTPQVGKRLPISPVWWAGAVLLMLFLPNAPYVVTDLVHLRDDIKAIGNGPVVSTVLPVYGVFIASGFVAYYLVLAELRGFLERSGLGAWRTPVMLTIHFLCAIGVFLGRWVRLNSWEPVVEPRGTFERMVLALTWEWAPILIAAVFVATALGHFVTRAVVEASVASARRGARLVRGLRLTPPSADQV